ncbi:MAG: hypothetical protein QME07_04305 [bacterium]|nr:hypothetical protein [bacterium]
MDPDNGIVDNCDDSQDPHPSHLLLGKGLNRKIRECSTTYPPQQDVLPVWILRVECPKEHGIHNYLGYPDSFHLFSLTTRLTCCQQLKAQNFGKPLNFNRTQNFETTVLLAVRTSVG